MFTEVWCFHLETHFTKTSTVQQERLPEDSAQAFRFAFLQWGYDIREPMSALLRHWSSCFGFPAFHLGNYCFRSGCKQCFQKPEQVSASSLRCTPLHSRETSTTTPHPSWWSHHLYWFRVTEYHTSTLLFLGNREMKKNVKELSSHWCFQAYFVQL